MQKQFLKFKKGFKNIAFVPLILISNNSELTAKFLPNEVEQLTKTLEISNINNGFFQGFNFSFNYISCYFNKIFFFHFN